MERYETVSYTHLDVYKRQGEQVAQDAVISSDLKDILPLTATAFWFFIGAEFIVPLGKDMKSPKKVPLSMVLSLGIMGIIQILLVFGFKNYTLWSDLGSAASPHVLYAVNMLGKWGKYWMIIVAISVSYTHLDKVHFQLLTLEQAETIRKNQDKNINLDYTDVVLPKPAQLDASYSIMAEGTHDNTDYKIRLQGEENILVEYGDMVLDIELRFRVHILMNEIEKSDLPVIDMTPGIRSLQVHFDVNKISAREVCEKVKEINANLSSLDDITVPSRIIKLPLSWDDPQTQLAAKRYQQTVRQMCVRDRK